MTPAMGYTEMKDSGIEWLGKIPNDWYTIRAKYAFKIKKEIAGELGHTVLSVTQRGIKPKDMSEKGQFSLDYSKYQLVDSGDFIMNHMDLLTGWVDISNMNGVTSPDYRVFQSSNPEQYYPDFYRYVFQTCYQQRIFYGFGQGVSGFGRWRLPAETFLNFYLPVPPYETQFAIASYLDAQCTKIDEIIAQAKASIENYKQWKASIIYEAVTKGLDPNVEMKDSGIEWIGKVPSRWEISRVKNVVTNLDCLREPISAENRENKLGLYDYYGASGVIDKIDDYNVDDTVLLIGEDGANLRMRNLPLVYRASGKFWVNNHAHILKVRPGYSYGFIAYLLEAGDYNVYITGSAQPKLSQFNLMRFPIVVPGFEEQVQIEKYLDKWCMQIDALIEEKEAFLEELESYKKSLIYEVVTGKKRVKGTSEVTIAVLSPEILRYRKALIMLRVLDLLGNDARGRIQLQKCMFAAECLLNMPFRTQFIRYEHGPYDPDLLNIEEIVNKRGWYTVLKGSPVTYQKGKEFLFCRGTSVWLRCQQTKSLNQKQGGYSHEFAADKLSHAYTRWPDQNFQNNKGPLPR